MTLLSALVLAFLAYMNYRISGRGLVYPPVAFCAVWAADLCLLWATGNYFLPLSDKTLMIFVCGCIVFSAGSFVALMWKQEPLKDQPFSSASNRNLNVLLLLCVLAFPFFLRWTVGLVSDYNSADTLLQAVRWATVDETWGSPPGYTLFMNVATLARILALVAYYEGGPIRRVCVVSLSMVFDLLMGTRSSVITFLFALLCLEWIRRRRLPWNVLVSLGLLFIVAFSFIAVAVEKGDARADAPVADNVIAIERDFVEYAAGGLVAFDQVVREPSIVAHSWRIERPFLETLNKFGARFELSNTHADWVNIGPTLFNVYTFYFAYIDLGYAGMTMILFLLGLVTAYFYKRAIYGSRLSALIYSMLFSGLLLSIFLEAFFFAINFLVKLCAVYWLIYCFPLVWTKWFARSDASSGIARPRPVRG